MLKLRVSVLYIATYRTEARLLCNRFFLRIILFFRKKINGMIN